MRNRDAYPVWRSVDWLTIVLYVVLIIGGLISIYGASYDFDNPGFFDLSARPGMQMVWIGASVILISIILMLDKSFFETFAYIIYGLIILLLILTLFLASDIKGSHSWLVITSSIRLQPAEFAKFATALALAKFMNTYWFNLFRRGDIVIYSSLILVPMCLIIMQKEAGSALVFISFFIVLYRKGLPGYLLFIGVCAVAFFVIALKYETDMWGITPVGRFIVAYFILLIIWAAVRFIIKDYLLAAWFLGITLVGGVIMYVISFYVTYNLLWLTVGLIVCFSIWLIGYSLKKLVKKYIGVAFFALISLGYLFSVNYVFNEVLEYHQQQRIKVLLGLEDDPVGAGYNVNQSKIAIGSGGFFGKGFLNGTQTKLKYVPEQDTDFIFCTVGEEFGFVGTLFVLMLYGIFLLRLIALAERQSDTFGRMYGYGVVSIFLFHVVVNIGMVCGLTPVIGIPLPFFSYGGSSMLGFTVLLFIFLRIDAGRKEDTFGNSRLLRRYG